MTKECLRRGEIASRRGEVDYFGNDENKDR